MPGERLLKIRVLLKGRPYKTFVFNKEVITVGRNPEADVFLDNPGISREHLQLYATPHGTYAVEDLNSANGTFVNDVVCRKQNLLDNDIVRVGKFSLWITYGQERRQDDGMRARASSTASEGTTVLSRAELKEMIVNARKAEETQVATNPSAGVPRFITQSSTRAAQRILILASLLSFLAGYMVGMGAMILLRH